VALLYSATADRMNISQNATINTLSALSCAMWCRTDAMTSDRLLLTKANTATTGLRFRRGTATEHATNLVVVRERATTSTTYATAHRPLRERNVWRCVAFSLDLAASPVVHIYTGALGVPVWEGSYGTATDGSGAIVSDSTGAMRIGNDIGASPALSWQGDIGPFAFWNRVLSVEEFRQWQENAWSVLSGNVVRMFPGGDLSGANPFAWDWSGNRNLASVTGPVDSPDPPWRSNRHRVTPSIHRVPLILPVAA
jgi:hypothetical protein